MQHKVVGSFCVLALEKSLQVKFSSISQKNSAKARGIYYFTPLQYLKHRKKCEECVYYEKRFFNIVGIFKRRNS